MDQDAAHSYCRGLAQGGGRCDCEEFLSPKDFDSTAPLRCAECHHGPSKHPRQPTSAPKETSAPAASLSSQGSSVSASTARESVLSIFNQTVSSSIPALPLRSVHSAEMSSGSKKVIGLNDARMESLKGFRPQSSGKRGKKEKASFMHPYTYHVRRSDLNDFL